VVDAEGVEGWWRDNVTEPSVAIVVSVKAAPMSVDTGPSARETVCGGPLVTTASRDTSIASPG
jgi:hypothetical protein